MTSGPETTRNDITVAADRLSLLLKAYPLADKDGTFVRFCSAMRIFDTLSLADIALAITHIAENALLLIKSQLPREFQQHFEMVTDHSAPRLKKYKSYKIGKNPSYLTRPQITLCNKIITLRPMLNQLEDLNPPLPLHTAKIYLYRCLMMVIAPLARINKNPISDRISENKSSSNRKILNCQIARLKTAELIEELRPPNGWSSEWEAANVIAPILTAHLTELEEPYPQTKNQKTLMKTLRKWMLSYDLVQLTYMDNATKHYTWRLA
jgi:hypothetical protein